MLRTQIAVGIAVLVAATDCLVLLQLQGEPTPEPPEHRWNGTAQPTPRTAAEMMKSKVEALERSLGEVRKHDAAALARRRAAHLSKLTAQRKKSREVELVNAKIALRVKKLGKSNEALRHRGEELVRHNGLLISDLETLRSDLQSVQEFLQAALNASDEGLTAAPELAVFAELAESEAATSRALQRKKRMSELAGSFEELSLLAVPGRQQTKGRHLQAEAAVNIMDDLMSDLAKVSKEQNASEASLDKVFDKRLRRAVKRHAALLEEQAQLRKAKEEALKLHVRLSESVRDLSLAHNKLLAQRKSIRRFTARLDTSLESLENDEFANETGSITEQGQQQQQQQQQQQHHQQEKEEHQPSRASF